MQLEKNGMINFICYAEWFTCLFHPVVGLQERQLQSISPVSAGRHHSPSVIVANVQGTVTVNF